MISYLKLATLAAVGLLTLGCSSSNDPGEPKHFVRGVVHVNGEPAHRVAVTFHHNDTSLPSGKRFATGVTDESGQFELSSEGDRDGTIAGNYSVTFAWLSANDISAYDMFRGVFSKPETSTYNVVVPRSGQEELIFDLNVPEEKLRRPKK